MALHVPNLHGLSDHACLSSTLDSSVTNQHELHHGDGNSQDPVLVVSILSANFSVFSDK